VKTRNFQLAAAGIVVASLALFFTKDFETEFPQHLVLRDSTATVIATGVGMQKLLLVNGMGMTNLTPVTKRALVGSAIKVSTFKGRK
jgi:hypothetical protein